MTVPCDTPLFPHDLVARLAKAAREADAEIAMVSRARAKTAQLQHPAGVLPAARGRCWKAWCDSRRAAAARSTPGPAQHKTVLVPFDRPGDDARAFFNANTLAELHLLGAAR